MSKYGITLAVALAGGALNPAWAGHRGFFHHGCYGGVGYGCYGAGCYGGVTVSFGCYGSIPTSYGCCGGTTVSYGCSGSVAFGSGSYSSGCYPAVPVSYGCCGGSTAGYGSSCYGGTAVPALPPAAPETTPSEEDQGDLPVASPSPAEPRPLPASREAPRVVRQPAPEPATADRPAVERVKDQPDEKAPATIVVSLPAEAKLTINRTLSRSTATTRRFVTPPLPSGKDFYYTLKAEVVRDGQPVELTRRVTVRAGAETHIAFESRAPADVAQRE
jgi:uncharacterized protein (TIGR03000 family)